MNLPEYETLTHRTGRASRTARHPEQAEVSNALNTQMGRDLLAVWTRSTRKPATCAASSSPARASALSALAAT